MILHCLKIAWRNLQKYKLQSVICVVGIAVGFTAFIFGGYWQYWETHFDDFHPAGEKVYAITTVGMIKAADGREADLNQLHMDDANFFMKSLPEIKDVCLIGEYYFNVGKKGGGQRFSALCVDTIFFQYFQAEFLDGGYKGVVPDGKLVVLTARMAKQFFGTVNCVGKEIDLGEENDEDIRRVAGVIKNYPDNTELFFDLLVIDRPEYMHCKRIPTYVRLADYTDVEKVREKIEGHKSIAVDPYGITVPSLWKFKLRTLPEVHLTCNPGLYNRFRNIRILELAGLLALVGALMNHLVLFIGQQQKRRREQITRISMGSSRWNMVGKALVEVLLPMLMAFLVVFCLIELLFPFYREFTTITKEGTVYDRFVNQMDREGLWVGVLKYMGICIVFFLAVSVVPIYGIVKNSFRGGVAGYRSGLFRRFLIVGQIFIGSLFFVSSLALYRQLYFLKSADKGIHIENITQIFLGFRTTGELDLDLVKRELLENPMVEDITLTMDAVLSPHGIFYGNRIGYFPIEGRDREKFKATGEEDYIFTIEENFFNFFGIRLKSGTLPMAENPDDVVVNETGEGMLGFPDLLQRHMEGNTYKVVGVIKDYHYSPMQYPIQKVFFLLERKEGKWHDLHYIYVKMRPENKDQAMRHIRSVMKKYDRGEVSEEQMYVDLPDVLEEFNKPEETIFRLFCTLALLCILISSFGIYSLVSLSAEQRKEEIAIRKINGATLPDILRLFFKEYLLLVVVGNVLALPLGYRLMQKWLETYAYRVELGSGLFVGVFVITCLIVLFSIFRQVRRAAMEDPVGALKR